MIYFESRSNSNLKFFTVKFPLDTLDRISWDGEELEQLKFYDQSELVADKLRMLTMITEKLEEPTDE